MAKKFGKFLLFTAAAGAAAAGVYYYFKNKEKFASAYDLDEDEDYDDFSDDLDDSDSASRSYVSLNKESGTDEALSETTLDDEASDSDETADGDFSSLAQHVAEAAEQKVEEFFDEEEL